jgi:hypothetical protein
MYQILTELCRLQNLVTIGHSGKKRIKDYKMDIKPSEFYY